MVKMLVCKIKSKIKNYYKTFAITPFPPGKQLYL